MSSWGVKPQGILRTMLKNQSLKGKGKPLKYFEHGIICNLERSYTCYLCRTDSMEDSPKEYWKICQQAFVAHVRVMMAWILVEIEKMERIN